MPENNFWLIEVYGDDTANVSVTSKEEVEALKKMDEIEEWMFASCSETSEDEMIERAEEHGLEHDPW
jgi:transcriptional regulator of NAD metabolism